MKISAWRKIAGAMTLVAALGGMSTTAAANCGAVLAQNLSSLSYNRSTEAAVYSVIDSEDEWNRAKGGSAAGRYWMIHGSGNYNEYNNRRREFLSNSGFSMSDDLAIHFVTATLSDQAINAWRDCEIVRSRPQFGLFIQIESISSRNVTLTVRYFPRVPQPVTVSGVYVDGARASQNLVKIDAKLDGSTDWDANTSVALTIPREALDTERSGYSIVADELTINIGAGSFSATVTIPQWIEYPEVCVNGPPDSVFPECVVRTSLPAHFVKLGNNGTANGNDFCEHPGFPVYGTGELKGGECVATFLNGEEIRCDVTVGGQLRPYKAIQHVCRTSQSTVSMNWNNGTMACQDFCPRPEFGNAGQCLKAWDFSPSAFGPKSCDYVRPVAIQDHQLLSCVCARR